MAERRMRLKRGKIGDTGVVEPPAPSIPEPIFESKERGAFDEDLVSQITAMVDPTPFDSHEESIEKVKRAIKLTMATVNMQHVLSPPARGLVSIAPSLAEVRSIDVTIRRSTNRFNMNPVSITVAGRGDPIQLLRAAIDDFHSGTTSIITYD